MQLHPRAIRSLSNGEFRDVAGLSCHPWVVEIDGQLDVLHAFVQDRRRRQAVIVWTGADERLLPIETHRFLLDESWLDSNCRGIAQVFAMPRVESFGWSGRLGRTWSSVKGGVGSIAPVSLSRRTRGTSTPS